MELFLLRFTNDSFKNLSVKLQKFKVTFFSFWYFADKFLKESFVNRRRKSSIFTRLGNRSGLKSFLQALPRLKSLDIFTKETRNRGGCSHHNGNNLLPRTDAAAVFSTCGSLETLELGGTFGWSKTTSFFRFCKECVTLRKLVIKDSDMPNKMFVKIQNCSLLEELRLCDCDNVNASTLIKISKGCPNLRSVSLTLLPPICDKGLKCFAKCRNLSTFETDSKKVTDETLVELAKCGNLIEFQLFHCPLVSDLGCAAVLTHCPQLELLSVECCERVSNGTVDSAVQCRENGLVLQMIIGGTRVSPQTYEKLPSFIGFWE